MRVPAWVKSDFRLKAIALIGALVAWMGVVYAQDPPTAVNLPGVSLSHGQPPKGLVLIQEPSPVSVTLTGLVSQTQFFKKDSVRAFVDVGSAHAGVNWLPVRIQAPGDGLSVAQVRPAMVEVDLDKLGTKTVKVEARVSGQPAGCCAAGTPAVQPAEVTLEGPESALIGANAYVKVDVSGRQAAAQQNLPILVEGAGKSKLPSVTAVPAQAQVSVPIDLVKAQRKAPVLANVVGQPKTGFRVIRVDVTPLLVVLEGTPEALEQVAGIDSSLVDVSAATGDVTAVVTLVPPAGARVLTPGPYVVHVYVQQDPTVGPSPTPVATPSPPSSPPPSPAASPSPSPAPSPRPSPRPSP